MPKPVVIAVSIQNRSLHNLDWVKVDWTGRDFNAGVLSIGVYKTIIDMTWPNVILAQMTFVDAATRHPYTIQLSFKEINELILKGKCSAITIKIVDYDKAEIICGSPVK